MVFSRAISVIAASLGVAGVALSCARDSGSRPDSAMAASAALPEARPAAPADTLRAAVASAVDSGTPRAQVAVSVDVPFERALGVLHRSRDAGPCLTIADTAIAVGTPFVAVATEEPQRAVAGHVGRRRERDCTEPGDEWGAVIRREGPSAAYDVALDAGASVRDLGIAVVGLGRLPPVVGGRVALDVDGNGRAELFAQCASREGIHLSVASDSGAGRPRRWERYFYVPYDLEPNCPTETRGGEDD